MKIGIDISQTAYDKTGVGNYLSNLVTKLLETDKKNEYVLFFSSLRRSPSLKVVNAVRNNPKAHLKTFKFPPTVLNLIWNKLHLFPIENFVGKVDFFITSDWTEPPAKYARKATIIYDLVVYKYPEETHSKTELRIKGLNLSSNIVQIQTRKLKWVKKESDLIFAISNSTKRDVEEILGISEDKIRVIYPGA